MVCRMEQESGEIMKIKKNFFLICLLFLVSLVSGCGGNANADNSASDKGSTGFRNFALTVSGDGGTMIYVAERLNWFSEEAFLFPEDTNYMAVYDGKMYYADTPVGTETGETAAEACRILCRDLQDTAAEEETVLEMPGIAALGDAMIQEGVLYCSWLTAEDEIKHTVVELENGKKTELSLPQPRKIAAVTAENYYYIEGREIYSCNYESGEEALFCEAGGEVCAVYCAGDSLCILSNDGTELVLEQFDKEGNLERSYRGLEKAGMDFTGRFAAFVKAEGNILFYELSGETDESGRNTFLVRMDLGTEEKEILGSWYTP